MKDETIANRVDSDYFLTRISAACMGYIRAYENEQVWNLGIYYVKKAQFLRQSLPETIAIIDTTISYSVPVRFP